jgi:YebC/PmpR family DNA-binding regulatory protein
MLFSGKVKYNNYHIRKRKSALNLFMAGHSRWANIKRKKGVNDQKKSGVFTKLSRNITIAVIEGGGIAVAENNVKLRLAIDKAKAANMPGETIKRAIDKGAGADKNMLQQAVYEAFGPHGSTFIIPTATDNTNRSIAEIRLIIERNGGKLASPGAVNYLFEKMGVLRISEGQKTIESILELADSIQATDIVEDGNETELYFPYEQLGKIEESGAEEIYKPLLPVTLSSKEQEEEVIALMELIDDHEDVQQIFSNIDFQYI